MTPRQSTEPAPRRQEQRSEQTRSRVCVAAGECLDELGYSETSIQRVQERAGVSRGALMHQFATKEDMIVETLARLLAPTRSGRAPADARRNTVARGISVEDDLLGLWFKVVNSPQGRAVVEILVAARTDAALRDKVEPILKDYDAAINQDILRIYRATNGDDDDVVQLWTICRVFMRSLHLQERFLSDPKATRATVRRFAELIAPHLAPRDPAG